MATQVHIEINDFMLDVLNSIAAPVVVINQEGWVVMVNAAFITLTGSHAPNGTLPHITEYAFTEVSANTLRELFDSGTVPIDPIALKLRTAQGDVQTYQWRGRKLESDTQLLVLTGNRVQDAAPTAPSAAAPTPDMIDHAVVGMFTYTSQGITYANRTFGELLGYDSDTFLNLNRDSFIKYVQRGSQGAVLLFLENTLRNIDKGEDYLIPFVHSNGDTMWMHTYLSRLETADSPVLVVTCIDVSHRMATERSLRRSEALYRHVVRTMPDAIYVLDLDTMAVEFFDESFLGYSRDTLFEKNTLLNAVYPDDRKEVLRHWEGMFSLVSNAVQELTYRIRHAAGHWEWVESRYVITERNEDYRPLEVLFLLRVVTRQQHIESRLRESEIRYHDMFEHSGVMNLLVDPQTNTIVDANTAAAAFYGYDQDALRGRSLDVVNPQVPERFFGYVRNVLENDNMIFGSVHHTREGVRRDVQVYGSPTQHQGKPLVHLVITDYTEQQKIEQALRNSEARMMQLIHQNADAIVLVDDNGIIRFANTTAERLFERNTDDLVGTPFGAPLSLKEVTLIDIMQHSGDVRTAEMRIVDIEWENEHFTLASLRDMTERIRAEKALGESELRFRTMFDDAPMGIFVVDRRGYPVMMNRAFRDMLGYADETELLGSRFLDFTHPDDIGISLTRFQAILHGQINNYQIEKRYIRKDGGTLWARVNVARFSMEESSEAFLIAMIEDITNAQLIEEQHTRLQREQHRLDILSDFIRHISHEFRTPLSVITTCLYIIRRTVEMTEPLQVQLSRIALQNQSIIQLVDDLVTILRLEKGEGLNYGHTNINELIKMVCGDLKHTIEDKQQDVDLQFNNQVENPWLSADDMRIAIRHLISNASRHSKPGNTITIRVTGNINMLKIAVIDEGEGISAERLPHIFDSFWRGDEARTERGFGLGLGIVRRVVESHGGYMNVKSEVNRGSTFTINIPLVKQTNSLLPKSTD